MEKIVLCFEIKNIQADYSAVMQIIDLIENGAKINTLVELQNICNTKYCWIKDEKVTFKNRLKIVEGIEAAFAGHNTDKYWTLHPLHDLDQVVKKREEYDFRYYVRVHAGYDVKNVQYAILLLQQFQTVYKRIEFFFVPFVDFYEAEYMKWKNVNIYYKYSHFLRFILLKYKQTFFGAYYNSNVKHMEIRVLSSKRVGIQSTFFPLLEIDQDMLSVVTKYICFEAEKTRFHDIMIDDLVNISYKILNYRLKNEKGKNVATAKIKYINQVLEHEYATVLKYAIFCVLVPEKGHLTEELIIESMRRAENITYGLIQIIENVVLHSTKHKGIFTFRITGQDTRQLEIDISDSNRQETILDNFKKKIIQKGEYFNNISLNISHFFGQFLNYEEKQAWEGFQRVFPVKYMGLRRLAHELERCNASFKVRSNTNYKNNKKELFYIVNRNKIMKDDNNMYIPGTQYHIVIPILQQHIALKQHNANIFFNAVGGLMETDAVYAKFIDWQCKQIKFKDLFALKNNMIEIDQYYFQASRKNIENSKEQMVQFWHRAWDNWVENIKVEDRILYFIDLTGIRELTSAWGIEVFCKGLVGSKVLVYDKIQYFAFINANDEMIKMFFETILYSGVQLNASQQIYICKDNHCEDILICGNDKDEIIRNAYQFCFRKGKLPDFLQKQIEGEIEQSIQLCPFDVIISEEKGGKTLFEKYIEDVADELLTSEDMAGYKLVNSHMRLGNKVHLMEFYELSILFRKPHVSKKIALLLIRKMIEEDFDIMQNILFYGYASYSRTILIALVEIMKQYHILHKSKNYFLDFAVYQNDIMIQRTLIDISPKVRMYFSGRIPKDEEIKIIQIVPISTTLTTFKKMWDMFCREKLIENKQRHPDKNYTLFWVRDLGEENQPTKIEEEYWSKICEDKNIETNLIKVSPKFFCCKKTKWFNPLNCERCYPKNVLDEIALIETDVTSTVPSQQLEVIKECQGYEEQEITNEENCNENRIVDLKESVYYGHISRDVNHFQYYIDTVTYFQKQKNHIASWLREKAKIDGKRINEKGALNIIVTPHHHTNVEFGHYVNEYYFNGTADIVTIDSSKEYRSNIILKYADIKKIISETYKIGREVRFVYVDDTIITGTTFKRVNNLLYSLIPQNLLNLFEINKVFVLVNRLSSYSKLDYVKNMNEDFCAFVNLNISSIRNFGDSCTMCTLQRNSELFRKRASTFSMTSYWDKKQDGYKTISFDKYDDPQNMQKGYIRMLCSHYAKSHLIITQDMITSICNIIDLMLLLDKEESLSPIYNLVLLKNKKEALQAYLKILARPFFSYGRIYRQSIMDLLLLMAEFFLNSKFKSDLIGNEEISEKKEYLNDKNLRKKVLLLCQFTVRMFSKDESVEFVQKYLLEGLTDLRSNYIIRKVTLENIHKFIGENENQGERYDIYSQMIHRLINSSADETKSLWLEYLLTTGKENNDNMNDYDKITLSDNWKGDGNFQKFWETLFIENTRLCYDSMLNFVNKAVALKKEGNKSEAVLISSAVEALWKDYYIRNLVRFIKIEILVELDNIEMENIELEIKRRAENMAELLWLLKKERVGGLERYEKLKKCVEKILYKEDQLQIFTTALTGIGGDNELCPVTDFKRKRLSHNNLRQLKENLGNKYFQQKGFYIGSNYVIVCVGNQYEKKIQPLYFYIQCNETERYKMILRARRILLFRNQIVYWIEEDFNNNALPILVEEMSANRQLMRDKAGDHSSRTDISSLQRLLQAKYNNDKYQNLYRWMLLRQYVNMRVARVFRSEWSKNSEDTRDKLYTLNKNADAMNGPLVNLGKSFFGKTLGDRSPFWYFESIYNMFEFSICIDGKVNSNVDMKIMEKLFNKMNGRHENGYYYKQEYIICMIMDILFSAIKTCRNWKIAYDENLERLEDLRYLIKEDEMITCFVILSKDTNKCKIWIEQDASYLVFRNKVAGMGEVEVMESNKKIEELFRSKETEGISLQTIKWYVESLCHYVKEEAVFKYEWNDKTGEAEFVSKLPILSWEEQNENVFY